MGRFDTLIVGAGGHGRVVLDILQAGGRYRPVGFVDADPKLKDTRVGGLPVFGGIQLLNKLKLRHQLRSAIIAIGDNRARAGYVQTLAEHGLELINAIHPSANISTSATLGANVVIAAHATVCADATIGELSIINTAAVVDHECEIGRAAHICPGVHLAGRVRVGDSAFVGLGANVIQCLSIGSGAVIGAGAVVLADIPAGVTAVGVPARVIKRMVAAA